MQKEYLYNVSIQVDDFGIELEDIQCRGKRRNSDVYVSGGEYGEKIVYGFMEIGVCDYYIQNSVVFQEGYYIEVVKGDGKLDVKSFQFWNFS